MFKFKADPGGQVNAGGVDVIFDKEGVFETDNNALRNALKALGYTEDVTVTDPPVFKSEFEKNPLKAKKVK